MAVVVAAIVAAMGSIPAEGVAVVDVGKIVVPTTTTTTRISAMPSWIREGS
jgi:hypothetical protein